MRVKVLLGFALVTLLSIIIAIKLLYKKPYTVASPTVANNIETTNAKPPPETNEAAYGVTAKVKSFKSFCVTNKMDTGIAYFINMHLPSNTFRFFVVDLKTGAILKKSLVAHGSGSGSSAVPVKFSNIDNSLCTSLGRYKIGAKYTGKFGLSYKLYGLDSTNNNAYKRAIVMHSYTCVPNEEIVKPLCLSWGCPMVSARFIKEIDAQLKGRKKPVGLWIYY